MLLLKRELILRFLATISIGIVSHSGDRLLNQVGSPEARAICDNLTHAVVGGLTWALITMLAKKSVTQNIYSIVSCLLISSFIDLDHFISARSWRLDDATHLDKRPFLHCSTIPLVIWLLLLLCSKTLNYPSIGYCAWIIFAGFMSHHIRDGTRRGLWFCPIGSTQPIPYYLYICISMGLPYIIYWLMPTYETEVTNNFGSAHII